jgi:hypothetical protein
MTITPPDDARNDKARSFEELLKAIGQKVDATPEEMRIAPLPPSERVYEETKEAISKTGLVVGGTPATVVSISGEFVERAKLGIGRAGIHKKLPVFAFLYPNKKRFDVFGIFPRDGVHPRQLGQAIYWSIVSDIPPHIAQSRPLTMDDFWKIDAFDTRQLVETPVLNSIKRELEEERDREIALRVSSAEAEVQKIRQTNPESREEIQQIRRRCERHAANAVQNHNRAEKWKLIALCLGTLALLALIARYLA